jgi:hypothetical protein
MLDTSRSVPSPSLDRMGPCERKVWSICEESQLSPAAVADGDGGSGCGAVWPEARACCSHASRDLWSMGHAVGEGESVAACCESDFVGTPSRSTLALAPIVRSFRMCWPVRWTLP